MVPHITDAVQEWVTRVAQIPVDGDEKVPDVCIIEVIELLSEGKEIRCEMKDSSRMPSE